MVVISRLLISCVGSSVGALWDSTVRSEDES